MSACMLAQHHFWENISQVQRGGHHPTSTLQWWHVTVPWSCCLWSQHSIFVHVSVSFVRPWIPQGRAFVLLIFICPGQAWSPEEKGGCSFIDISAFVRSGLFFFPPQNCIAVCPNLVSWRQRPGGKVATLRCPAHSLLLGDGSPVTTLDNKECFYHLGPVHPTHNNHKILQ